MADEQWGYIGDNKSLRIHYWYDGPQLTTYEYDGKLFCAIAVGQRRDGHIEYVHFETDKKDWSALERCEIDVRTLQKAGRNSTLGIDFDRPGDVPTEMKEEFLAEDGAFLFPTPIGDAD